MNTENGNLNELKRLSKRLTEIIADASNACSEEVEALVLRIKALLNQLRASSSKRQLRRVLGSLVFVFGFGGMIDSNAQSFATPVTNAFGLSSTVDLSLPAFVDIDNDGDLDVFVGEYYGNLQYFQNTGTSTNPQFASPIANPFGITAVLDNAIPAFVDLDNDGDFDIMVGEYYGNYRYFQNTGTASNPQFAAPVTNPFGITPKGEVSFPSFADIDGDGDFDALFGEADYYASNNKMVRFFRNTGSATSPAFQEDTTSTNPFNNVSSTLFAIPHQVDLDDDGDVDLLIGNPYGIITYYENTGTNTAPMFSGTPQVNPFGLQPGILLASIASGDLDDDGDVDLLVGEYYGATKYYENTTINVGTDEEYKIDIKVYPNPAKDRIRIDAGYQVIHSAEVLDMTGKVLIQTSYIHDGIDVTELSKGMYFIRVQTEQGDSGLIRFIKS